MIETIAAVATPPGAGALGILRLSGSRARPIAHALLRLAHPHPGLEPRRAALAAAYHGLEPIDKVVATFFPGPNSATGEDLVEISAHGSPYILRLLLESVLKLGARPALPGEFTQRAFLNGRLDLAQAEAVAELIRAKTQSAHRAALAQLEGGLSQAVRRAREPILELLVAVEARLDHPQEDLPGLEAQDVLRRLEQARDPITKLAESFQWGRRIAEGARIAILGRPNAGKSSLLNALLGEERAIVCPTPGTTRDTLEESCELQGLTAVLIDTAGIREHAADDAERQGMERSERALKNSDLTLLVIDSSRPPDPEDRRVHDRLLEAARTLGRPMLRVANKADLPWRLDGTPVDVSVSAREGRGLEHLSQNIAGLMGAAAGSESQMVLSARHADALRRAADALGEAAAAVRAHPTRWEDRSASSLRQALHDLGDILGENAPDEVLRGIFSKFCIGK